MASAHTANAIDNIGNNIMPAASLAQGSFSDNFEGATFDPYWTLSQQGGTISLSTAQAHSGMHSALFNSPSGVNRQVWLQHTYPDASKGIITTWLYDTTPGTNNIYALLDIQNTQLGQDIGVGIMDSNPSSYHVYASGIENVPVYQRSLGWHELKIAFNTNDVQIFIDSTLVKTYAGDYSFDSVRIGVQAPSYNPNGAFYFDDFSVQRVVNSKSCLVVQGTDNLIYYRTFTVATQTWNSWNSVPGSTFDSPTATLVGSKLYIAVRSADTSNQIYFGSVDIVTNAFSGWTNLQGQTPNSPTLTSG